METLSKRSSAAPVQRFAKIHVVAFDCDGVLFDSTLANKAYYNQILAHLGQPAMSERQFAYTHMHTVDESLAFLFPDDRLRAAAREYCRKVQYLPFIRHMQIEPHLKPLLARLRPRYKTAVATNRTNTMQRVIVEHGLEGQFDLVVSAADVVNPKPHPEQLLKIMDFFQVGADNLLFVGDSEVDARAAAAAGVALVAYNNPALSAAVHITSLAQIDALLAS